MLDEARKFTSFGIRQCKRAAVGRSDRRTSRSRLVRPAEPRL